MSTLLNQDLGAIADNYADVIEGGNTHRGSGTVYRGIPGIYPSDPDLRSGTDTPLTVVGSSVSTTTFDVAGTYTQARWVPEAGPAFWALCNTAGSNYEQARKVTGFNATTSVFTVAPAFTAAPSANDSMIMLQGFKRLPNQVDIEAEETEHASGWDRFFSISVEPGERLEYFGRGVETYITTLTVTLRLSKAFREADARASAFSNIAAIRAGMTKGANPDHRDGTYTRALYHKANAEVVKDDTNKVVIKQDFTLLYRINSELL